VKKAGKQVAHFPDTYLGPNVHGHRPTKEIEYRRGLRQRSGTFTRAARCTVWLDSDSAIDFSPMADSDNINNPLPIIDAVNNPVISNSDTPQVLFALQLTRSGRPGISGKTVDPRYHPSYDGCIECVKLPASGTRESDRIVSH
jgi:hypothetical protein